MTAFLPTRRTMMTAAAALIVAKPSSASISDPVVTCRAGRFSGTRASGIAVFRGIRYGRAERFQASVPFEVVRDTIPAVNPAPACPQSSKRRPQSEDCLALNIWTPALHGTAHLPVLVYIHGGGYGFGSANDAITDGQLLAARGTVVVTVNHRLNALGYLYLAELDPHFRDSGNSGQLDLILALKWVGANIEAFGGDPTRVTLCGQSGGGAKIATLLAMPAANGLFDRAVTMSGQQVTVSRPEHALTRTRAYLDRLKIADTQLDRLCDVPVERLIEALDAGDPIERSAIYFGPVRDGRWLTRDPFWPDANTAGRDVPLMLGGTHDEFRDFSDPTSPEMLRLTWDALPARLAAELPVAAPPPIVVATYRAHMPDASPADIFYAAATDGRSWRPQIIEAEARARGGRPAYVYQVNFGSPVYPPRGAFHGIDIGLLFGTLDAPDAWTGTGPDAQRLSRLMQDYVIAFAQTGKPNSPSLSPWPNYELDRRSTMVFDTKSRIVDDPRHWQRALFAPYTYIQPGT